MALFEHLVSSFYGAENSPPSKLSQKIASTKDPDQFEAVKSKSKSKSKYRSKTSAPQTFLDSDRQLATPRPWSESLFSQCTRTLSRQLGDQVKWCVKTQPATQRNDNTFM